MRMRRSRRSPRRSCARSGLPILLPRGGDCMAFSRVAATTSAAIRRVIDALPSGDGDEPLE